MDETFFFVGGVAIPLGMALLTLSTRQKEKDFAPAFAFFGFIFGMLFTSSANSDGSICCTNTSQTIPLWPALYLPILFTVLCLFAGLYCLLERVRL